MGALSAWIFWAHGMDVLGESRGGCPPRGGAPSSLHPPALSSLPPPPTLCARACTVNWKAASWPGTKVSEGMWEEVGWWNSEIGAAGRGCSAQDAEEMGRWAAGCVCVGG
eukprot:scaffold24272_cov94-Isochrysis_galbana.AAC.2